MKLHLKACPADAMSNEVRGFVQPYGAVESVHFLGARNGATEWIVELGADLPRDEAEAIVRAIEQDSFRGRTVEAFAVPDGREDPGDEAAARPRPRESRP